MWIFGGELLLLAGKFGGLGVSKAKPVKTLEHWNERLNKLLPGSLLEYEVNSEGPEKSDRDTGL